MPHYFSTITVNLEFIHSFDLVLARFGQILLTNENIHICDMLFFSPSVYVTNYYQLLSTSWSFHFFPRTFWGIESSQELHLFEIKPFSDIINVFTVTFDQFSPPLNKHMNFIQLFSFYLLSWDVLMLTSLGSPSK